MSLHKAVILFIIISYFTFTTIVIIAIAKGWTTDLNQFEAGLIGTILGGIAAKFNTIVDFLFGNADKKG